jgi:drug/metabolite transporter (DMT)-like permease
MTAPAPRPDRFVPGVVYICLSMLFFAVMDGISRHMTRDLGMAVGQILWVRFAFFIVFVVVLVGPRRLGPAFGSAFPWVQVLRGAMLIGEMYLFIWALRHVPVGDVHAVAAAAPLLVMVLASVFLGEKAPATVWLAVAAGMIGVALIVRPGLRDVDWTHVVPVVATVSWAVYQIMVRLVGRRDAADTTLVYTAVVGLAITSAIGPFVWQPVSAYGWLLLGLVSVLGAGAHLTLIKAYEACQAPRLQPFVYTLPVWAVIVGYVGLGELPGGWTFAGAGVIVVAGLFALVEERRWRRRRAAGSPRDLGRPDSAL